MDKKIFLVFTAVVIGVFGLSDGQYTCNINLGARRIHENLSPSSHDCRATAAGGNTCRGGQCVAYVKCYCTKNGKYPPSPSCWRPGAKVVTNGRCNTAIPKGTAVASFTNGKYGGHAGAFMGCEGNTIVLTDQWCSRALSVNKHADGQRYYVINSACPDVSGKRCRNEAPGGTACKSYW